MKLAIVGAGSSRLPLMLGSVARAARSASLDEVALFDVRPERARTLIPVGRELAAACGTLPPCRNHDTLDGCLEGADAVVFTIRPGFEEGRARDERTCLDLGVLGQETTGAAGLAFATRSLPALIDGCRRALASNPRCVLGIFTNPAGLVTRGCWRPGSRAPWASATRRTWRWARSRGGRGGRRTTWTPRCTA
jgi:6-phospho-beta-glucosidase